MTPEGKVKNKIKKLLDSRGDYLYYYMSVPFGYGATAVDFLGCYRGRFFAIEAKAPHGALTARQDMVLNQIRLAGGVTFVVVGDAGLDALEAWLCS